MIFSKINIVVKYLFFVNTATNKMEIGVGKIMGMDLRKILLMCEERDLHIHPIDGIVPNHVAESLSNWMDKAYYKSAVFRTSPANKLYLMYEGDVVWIGNQSNLLQFLHKWEK